MAELGKNGGYFSKYELHFKNNDARLVTERDSVIMGKNDLIWTMVNKLKFGSFANSYADNEVLGAQLNFEILIDGFLNDDPFIMHQVNTKARQAAITLVVLVLLIALMIALLAWLVAKIGSLLFA